MSREQGIQELLKALAQAEEHARDEQRRARDEQRRREEAEEHARDEQRRARDEQRRREEAEEHARDEQRRREEAEEHARDEQRRREEAEEHTRDEQRRREDTEQTTKLQTLLPYLEVCHSLSLAIQVVTDASLTTRGDPTNPVGRLYPKRIVPWDDFSARQEKIWDQLSEPSFASQQQFPSRHQMDYVWSCIRPISSELGLRNFERDTVENAVQDLVYKLNHNPLLQGRLGLRGTITFESHTNLGNTETNLSESLEHISLGQSSADDGPSALAAPVRKAQSKIKGKGKGNRADQFCIYATSNGAKIPKTAIEYKAPHKLTQDAIITGLASEIQPDRDIINKNSEGFTFVSKSLAAAVITQLFSYMIGKGIQYGYISTGQTFVFLYIPDNDPSIVYYHVSVPNMDVLDDDENRLHRTAVAQVFAFILQSLRAEPLSQSWHDAAEKLDVWAVKYDDVLERIPETVRKAKEPYASSYKPQRWRGFQRSPIRTRSKAYLSCRQPNTKPSQREDSDNNKADPPSPTAGRSIRSATKAATSSLHNTGNRGQQYRKNTPQQSGAGQQRIQDRPYCSHQCLLGLKCGGPMDKCCPNAGSHGPTHIDLAEFLDLIRVQLAEDRGCDADCTPLYLSGSIGALFKIRLSAYGYTLVAKGVQGPDLKRLEHEKRVYDQLRPLQGKYVPVCLGLTDLVLPYYYDGGVFEHLLFLGWAGKPLFQCAGHISKGPVVAAVAKAFAGLHRLQVLHGDAEARNITYHEGPMIVDFERAKLYGPQHLGSTGRNGQNRERQRSMSQKQRGDDPFVKELQLVMQSVSRCLGD